MVLIQTAGVEVAVAYVQGWQWWNYLLSAAIMFIGFAMITYASNAMSWRRHAGEGISGAHAGWIVVGWLCLWAGGMAAVLLYVSPFMRHLSDFGWSMLTAVGLLAGGWFLFAVPGNDGRSLSGSLMAWAAALSIAIATIGSLILDGLSRVAASIPTSVERLVQFGGIAVLIAALFVAANVLDGRR